MTSFLLNVTDACKKRIDQLLKPEQILRITVQSGGCHGFSFSFKIDNFCDAEKDYICDRVAVEKEFIPFIANSVVDYVDNIGASFFTLKNPNAKSSCGCGNSFSV